MDGGKRPPSGERPRLIVVGNGMAGMRTVEELLKLAPDLYDITVFGAEPHPNYNRILLSPVLAGEQQLEDIILNGLDWYRENGIRLHAGKRILDALVQRRRALRAFAQRGEQAHRLRLSQGFGRILQRHRRAPRREQWFA